MIVSFSRRFAFVAVPKTAGHAIRQALRPLLAANDWEQCTRYERRLFPVPALASIGHGHLGWADIKPFLLPGIWESLFTFAVIRNPFDRFLSYAHFRLAGTEAWRADPLAAMKAALTDPRSREHVLLRPQTHFLSDEAGLPMIDTLMRYETLQRDFDAVCARIGCAHVALERVNATPRQTGVVLDGELIALIQSSYALDFDQLDYSRDPAA